LSLLYDLISLQKKLSTAPLFVKKIHKGFTKNGMWNDTYPSTNISVNSPNQVATNEYVDNAKLKIKEKRRGKNLGKMDE
jgi:hypothetical protein